MIVPEQKLTCTKESGWQLQCLLRK